MPAHELSTQQNVVTAINPGAQRTTGTVNGADIDLAGYDACTAIIQGGVITDGTHTPKLQEADDDGTGAPDAYTDVAAADLVGAFEALTSDNDPLTQKVGYKGHKRWVRVVLVSADAATGGYVNAVVVRSLAAKAPVA